MPEERETNAVVIHVARQEDGKLRLIAQPIGDVRPSEIETILGSALQEWRIANRLPT